MSDVPKHSSMTKLEEAILLAVEAHQGQKDKAGMPYILHPLRMMSKMRTEAEMMTAVLHDVVEDTGWTLDDLRQKGFPEQVVHAVDCLTRRPGEDYMVFVKRSTTDPLARRVKLADLEDNMDIRRIRQMTEADPERLARYIRAWQFLVGSEGI